MTTITAEEYKASLPRINSRGFIKWSAETMGEYVSLLYPHITMYPGQTWRNIRAKYKFFCSLHGDYEAAAQDVVRERFGCQCAGCQRDIISQAGVVRAKRGTTEEKQLAADLYAQGLNYSQISERIGRRPGTVRRWLNPEARETDRQYSQNYYHNNLEKAKASRKRFEQSTNGKAVSNEKNVRRRLLRMNVPEFVFFEDAWHEVDRRFSHKIFGEVLLPSSERKAIQELYLEAQYLTETTGVTHHVDHIQPLSKGGEHCMLNLQILTADENLSKQDTFRKEDAELLCSRLFS